VKAVDTNILARYLTRDDPVQVPLADAVLAQPCFVTLTVLMETVWLLASRYGMTRHQIARALTALLELPLITTPDDALVGWAINRFANGADFADMIHIIAAQGADSFVSFEARLSRLAGPDSPLPIETLA
jgi:predicted nucleic-acid-binding protein